METLFIAYSVRIGFIVVYHTYTLSWAVKYRLTADAVCLVKVGGWGGMRDQQICCLRAPPRPRRHGQSWVRPLPLWGWVPALLWVVFGSIFIGAVHDFGALSSVFATTAKRLATSPVAHSTTRAFAVSVYLIHGADGGAGYFRFVIAAVFKQYPAAIFPCVVQIPIAVIIGVMLHRKGAGLLIPSLVALGVMYLTVIMGDRGFLGTFNASLAAWPIWLWVIVLLGYSYVASVLPV